MKVNILMAILLAIAVLNLFWHLPKIEEEMKGSNRGSNREKPNYTLKRFVITQSPLMVVICIVYFFFLDKKEFSSPPFGGILPPPNKVLAYLFLFISFCAVIMYGIIFDILGKLKKPKKIKYIISSFNLFKYNVITRESFVPASIAWVSLIYMLSLAVSVFGAINNTPKITINVLIGILSLGLAVAGMTIIVVARKFAFGRTQQLGYRDHPLSLRFYRDFTRLSLFTFLIQTLRLLAPFIHILLFLGGVYYTPLLGNNNEFPILTTVINLSVISMTIFGLSFLCIDLFVIFSETELPRFYYNLFFIKGNFIFHLILGLIIAIYVKEPPKAIFAGLLEPKNIWYPSHFWDYLRLLLFSIVNILMGNAGFKYSLREKRKEPNSSSTTGYTFGTSPSELIFLFSILIWSFGMAEIYRFVYFLVVSITGTKLI